LGVITDRHTDQIQQPRGLQIVGLQFQFVEQTPPRFACRGFYAVYAARLERKDAAVAIVLVDAVVNFGLTKKRERPLLMDSSLHFGRQIRVHGGHCSQLFYALPSVVEIAYAQIVLPELIL
jgi:hypothetical protein